MTLTNSSKFEGSTPELSKSALTLLSPIQIERSGVVYGKPSGPEDPPHFGQVAALSAMRSGTGQTCLHDGQWNRMVSILGVFRPGVRLSVRHVTLSPLMHRAVDLIVFSVVQPCGLSAQSLRQPFRLSGQFFEVVRCTTPSKLTLDPPHRSSALHLTSSLAPFYNTTLKEPPTVWC
jgi:hypothetical protein